MARFNHDQGPVRAALRRMYPLPMWAILYEVANGMNKTHTGYADAIAMGLFPSRGLDIHGFEIKTHRNDWLRELKNPDKAESVARYCEYWWLVTDSSDVANIKEVPQKWGLLVLDKKDLVVKKKARRLEAVEPDRPFIGAMLRRACEMAERERLKVTDTLEHAEEIRKARREGAKEVEYRFTEDLKVSTRDHEALKRQIEAFEQASGIKIDRWHGQKIGEAVAAVLSFRDEFRFNHVESLSRDLEEKAKYVKDAAVALKQAATSILTSGKLSP